MFSRRIRNPAEDELIALKYEPYYLRFAPQGRIPGRYSIWVAGAFSLIEWTDASLGWRTNTE